MKNYFSTAILAMAFALLVPNNGAEATGTMGGSALSGRPAFLPGASVSQAPITQAPVAGIDHEDDAANPTYGWLMGLGFLGFVAARRLRGD